MCQFANKLLLAVAVAALVAGPASARTSDRNQPMDIEAGHQSGTLDEQSPTIFSGGVHITQGTLDIRSSGARVSFANGNPSRAVFNGGPVVLKQQMDDGTPMNARASTVDYDLNTETVVFTGDVQIVQPRGSMSGQRMVYNLKTGNVESGGGGDSGRVRMHILPRNATPATTSTPPATSQEPSTQDNH